MKGQRQEMVWDRSVWHCRVEKGRAGAAREALDGTDSRAEYLGTGIEVQMGCRALGRGHARSREKSE